MPASVVEISVNGQTVEPWDPFQRALSKLVAEETVEVEGNHYSAPERHIGRKIHARVGERMVELFLDKGGERIAFHHLKCGRNQYATRPEHMPDRLRAVRDVREPDYGDILLQPGTCAW